MKKYAIALIIGAVLIGLGVFFYRPARPANSFYLRSCQTGRLIGPIQLETGYLIPQLDEPNYIVAEPTKSELEVRKCLLQTSPLESNYFDVNLAEVINTVNLMLKHRLGEKAPPVQVELVGKSLEPCITMSIGKEDKSAYDQLCNIAAEAKFRLYVENGTIILSQKEFKEISHKSIDSDKQSPQEPIATPTSTQEQAAKEKEFLSDPDVVTCKLKKTTISKLDFPKRPPSFIRRMERENRENIKQGQITLANRPFKVLLGDRPEREFYLHDVEKRFGPYWWGSWSLHSYHKIDETYYQFATMEGDTKLSVRPYKGQLGLLRVGKGNRQLEKAQFIGSMKQAGAVAVPVGTIKERWPEEVTECTVPVGDYTPYIMHVTYDNLDICISNNYHTNAQGQSEREKQTVYGISIRKGQPYVLDFSSEPAVVFDEPGKDKTTFKRGEEIKFAAVLVDPELDIMIRGLDDKSVQVEKESSSGRKYTRPKSLDPKVVITRADGEVIAEGVMPFG